jgi:zinc protease
MTTVTRPAIRDLAPPKPPSISSIELSGEMRLIVVHKPSVPLAEIRLVLPLGSEQISNPAAPLVLSESLFAGTEDLDRTEIASAVERLGGSLGAHVDRDALIVGGSAIASNLSRLLALLEDVLATATFPVSEVTADRSRLADEVTIALSRPETIAEEIFDEAIYGNHPYATRIPRPTVLRRVTSPTLRELRKKVVSSRGATLVVVGDTDPKKVTRTVKDTLGNWAAYSRRKSTTLSRVRAIEPGPLQLRDRPGAVQSNVRIGGVAPARTSPDWPATALASLVTGGMFTSRLVTNLRERNGYAYSPRLRIHHGRAGSVSTFVADVATDVTGAALNETLFEFGRVASVGIEQDELDAARRYAIGTFLTSTATQAGLASTLAGLLADGVDPEYLATYPARLSRVTLSEVNRAARQYFAPSQLTTIVVGDARIVFPQLEILKERVELV